LPHILGKIVYAVLRDSGHDWKTSLKRKMSILVHT
jgi:hypothetical protein